MGVGPLSEPVLGQINTSQDSNVPRLPLAQVLRVALLWPGWGWAEQGGDAPSKPLDLQVLVWVCSKGGWINDFSSPSATPEDTWLGLEGDGIWDGVQDWGEPPEAGTKPLNHRNLLHQLILSPVPDKSEQHKLQVICCGSPRREGEARAAPVVLPLSALGEPIIPGDNSWGYHHSWECHHSWGFLYL